MRSTGRVLAHIQLLGFTVNHKKSNLQPRQQAEFLGILLDSVCMTVSLTSQRVDSLIKITKYVHLYSLVTAHRVQKTTHCPKWYSLTGQEGSLGLDAVPQDWPIGVL